MAWTGARRERALGASAGPSLVRVAGALAAAGLLAMAVLRRRLVVVTVIGMSMAPTYSPGDRVLVRRAPAHALRRGQVVVFEEPDAGGRWARTTSEPDGWMIKRLVAIPGDPVPRRLVPLLAGRPDASVPPGQLAVLGDNPNGSFDSQKFGYVPEDRVLGVVVRRLGRPDRAEGDR